MKFKNKRTFKNRILAMILAIAMLCTGINVTAHANEGTKTSSSTSATVYLSVSDDEIYVGNTENLEKPVVLQKLTVPYFDLALYGLEDFYYGSEATKESAEGKVTMLHAFIYATEVLYCGVDEADAGKGYLKEQNLLGTDTLSIDGKAGSAWMQKFWGMNDNLNYYKNYEYPLAGPGWGATADQILVQDGDVISFAHFSDWGFFSDSASGFHYLKANGQMTQVEVTKGVDKELSLEVYRTAQGENYTTLQKKITDENALFYASVDDLYDGRVSAWKELGITDTDGNLTVDVDSLPAGEYLIGIDGQPGVNTDAICSAPGAIRLTVKGPDAKDEAAAKEVTEKIDAIGEVTLESEGAIKEARTAYDALTDTQKELVTNKDVLEKAENTWKELKDAKDKNDAIEAATPKTITLSKTRFTYNGKTQKPKVTVKNAAGEVIPASNYTVNYSGNCKNVGKYKMTLTFKGNYNGTKTKTFIIEPKATSISSLKAGKKSFTVKWAKKTTQVSGYKVEYSTDKNFKKSVNSKVVLKNNSVSRTMKNLKAKKTYYVRVRTYKTVKYNGKSMHLHSKWSTVKKVTVK